MVAVNSIFTNEQVCALRKEYEQGTEKTVPMIAKEYGTNITVVKDMLYGRTYKNAGYTMDNKKAIENNKHKLGSKRRDIDIEKIKELHSKGWCNFDIIKEMKIHHSTLAKHLTELGLTPNKIDKPSKPKINKPKITRSRVSKPKTKVASTVTTTVSNSNITTNTF